MDRMLELQGVGWMKRKAVGIATMTNYVRHYTDDSGVECIDIKNVLTGGLKAIDENRTLNWTDRQVNHDLWGPIVDRAKRVQLDEIDDEYLKAGWLPEAQEHGLIRLITSSETAKSGKTWIIEQVRVSPASSVRRASTELRIGLGFPGNRWEAVLHSQHQIRCVL